VPLTPLHVPSLFGSGHTLQRSARTCRAFPARGHFGFRFCPSRGTRHRIERINILGIEREIFSNRLRKAGRTPNCVSDWSGTPQLRWICEVARGVQRKARPELRWIVREQARGTPIMCVSCILHPSTLRMYAIQRPDLVFILRW
jgi:hypothetical protein